MQNAFIKLLIVFILASIISCKNMNEKNADSLNQRETVSTSFKDKKEAGENKLNDIVKNYF